MLSSLVVLVLVFTPPLEGHWVADETGSLSPAVVEELDAICRGVDASGFGQLGVAVVRSTGGRAPRVFATNLFNDWGLGRSATNDGVLLFVALHDRKAEIVLGTGMPLSTAQTDAVMRDQVVANFKRGQRDQGLLAAAKALAALLARRAPSTTAAPTQGPVSVDPLIAQINALAHPPLPTEPAAEEPLEPNVFRVLQGLAPMPDPSPRSWVVDLSKVLDPEETARLDRLGDAVYAEGHGQLFFLVARTTSGSPVLPRLRGLLRTQLAASRKSPVAIVGLDAFDSNQAELELPPQLPMGRHAQGQRAKAVSALAQVGPPVERLLAAGSFAQEAMAGRLPAPNTDEVVSQALADHGGKLALGGGGGGVLGLLALRRWLRRRPRLCEHCANPRQLLDDHEEDPHLEAESQLEEQLGSVDYDVWWCGRCNDALVLRYGAFFTRYSTCDGCQRKTASSSTTTLRHATESRGGLVRVDTRCENCSHTQSVERSTARLSSSSSSSSSSWGSSSSRSSSGGGGSSTGSGSSGSW